jgi:hypothetical protein
VRPGACGTGCLPGGGSAGHKAAAGARP